MATIDLTIETFDTTINQNDTVIIDFWASWCGPCTTFAPVFAEASDQNADIAFAKVDTDAQQELAAAFGIQAIPTLAVFRDQILLYNQPGALTGEMLDDLIGQVRALDMDEIRQRLAEQEQEQAAGGQG